MTHIKNEQALTFMLENTLRDKASLSVELEEKNHYIIRIKRRMKIMAFILGAMTTFFAVNWLGVL